MKHLHTATKIGLAMTLIGMLGLLLPFAYFRYLLPASQPSSPMVVAPINEQVSLAAAKETIVAGHPNHLYIPSLQMSLNVTDGTFNPKTGQWTLSLDHAHFATISAQPNSKMGNTFIYGHYRPEVFARLHRIAPGSEAKISTDNGYTFTYKLQQIRETNPNDTSVFAYQGSPIMTIQTCSGAWFQNRQFFTFTLVGYEKSA